MTSASRGASCLCGVMFCQGRGSNCRSSSHRSFDRIKSPSGVKSCGSPTRTLGSSKRNQMGVRTATLRSPCACDCQKANQPWSRSVLLLTGEDHLVESSGLDLEPGEGEIGISCRDRDIVS